MSKPHRKLGEILIDQESITTQQLDEVLTKQQNKERFGNKEIGKILVLCGHISQAILEETLDLQALEDQGGRPYTGLETVAEELGLNDATLEMIEGVDAFFKAGPPSQEMPYLELPEVDQMLDWITIQINGNGGSIRVAKNTPLEEIFRRVNAALAEEYIDDFKNQLPPRRIRINMREFYKESGLTDRAEQLTIKDIAESDLNAEIKFQKDQARYEASCKKAEECQAFLDNQKMLKETEDSFREFQEKMGDTNPL